jgi:hypothetical protein
MEKARMTPDYSTRDRARGRIRLGRLSFISMRRSAHVPLDPDVLVADVLLVVLP